MNLRIMKRDRLLLAAQRRLPLFGLVILLALLLAACRGPETVETPTPAVVPLPQIEPTPPPLDAYPGPPDPAATADGYPAPPTPALPSGYPGDTAWFIRPAGLQCETPLYSDLDEAVAALQNAGVPVITAETVTLGVCEACGCPTSEHYRIEIPASARNTAMALEWAPE
jgi:hypothetical protein